MDPRTLYLAGAMLFALSTPASATMIVLHAIDHDDRVHCYTPDDQGYANPATQTVTSVTADSDIDVFVYLTGYEQAEGAGFHFVWPADWTYYGWSGDCLGRQATITDFTGNTIHIGTVFDAVTGGGLAPLGFASFTTGDRGEAKLQGTRYCASGGICYLSHSIEYTIEPGMTGRVAVGGSGYNPAAPTPVEVSTWGSIKARYR